MPKTAVITGASRGIGRSIAFMLAKNNYNLVLAAKTTEQELDKLPSTIYLVQSEIKKLYPNTNILPFKTNVQDETSVYKLTDAIKNEFGIENLCLAGGVALNCVANGKILEKKIASIINHKNIIGCQFHPEKSRGSGLDFLKKFCSSKF